MRVSEPLDPYAILGVARTASDAEIKAAYLVLVARYHPDKHQGNPLEDLAAQRMAEINRAYETLSDPVRRAAYDRAGTTMGAAPPGTGAGIGARAPRRLALIIGILLTLPLLLRFGRMLVRALIALGRLVLEGTQVLRGTPVLGVAVLLFFALLTWALFRRRRRNARNKTKPTQ
jgi:hypothetical protein